MGASNVTGALVGFLAVADGPNLGGGNAAATCKKQVIDGLKQIVGFPPLTSGGSGREPDRAEGGAQPRRRD